MAARPAVPRGVLEQVVDQHPQALRLPRDHRPVRRRVETRLHLGVPAPEIEDRGIGELGEVHGLGARGRPGLAARQRLELLDERRQPARVATRRLHRAGREVRLEARQRRTQLVAGVRGEAPGALERGALAVRGDAEAGQHRVEIAGQRLDLLRPFARRHALLEIGRSSRPRPRCREGAPAARARGA